MMPNLLLRYSVSLDLTGTDILVLLACFYYQQQGRDDVECRDLARLLNLPVKSVQNSIDSMIATGLIIYNKDNSHNFTGLFEKIADLWAEEKVQAMQAARKEAATTTAAPASGHQASAVGPERTGRLRSPGRAPGSQRPPAGEADEGNLPGNLPGNPPGRMKPPHLYMLETFEQEFGRALSQIETATINGWSKDKGYSEALIFEALTKAVLRGALNLTYIERILADWSKKNLRTVQDVDRYEKQYLSARQSKKEKAKTVIEDNKSKIEENKDKYKDFFVI